MFFSEPHLGYVIPAYCIFSHILYFFKKLSDSSFYVLHWGDTIAHIGDLLVADMQKHEQPMLQNSHQQTRG